MVKLDGGYYQCELCFLHYKDKELAEACEAWDKEHKSCNLEIAEKSIEAEKTHQK